MDYALLARFAIGVAGLVAVIVLAVMAKNVHIKLGDKEIDFHSRKDICHDVAVQTVRVVTEYADFKYALKEERDKAVFDLHRKAKWSISTGLDSYYQTITEAMVKYGAAESRVVAIMAEGVRGRQTEYLMDIYEQNHLAKKTDDELLSLTEERYPVLANIFRSYAQTYWIGEFGQVSDLFAEFEKGRPKSKQALYGLLAGYRELSRAKEGLYEKVDRLDSEVRDYVLANGKLPSDAMQKAQDIHHDGLCPSAK